MIIDAYGRRVPPTSAKAPVLLGCAFARKNVREILHMDDKMVLASDATMSYTWRTPTRGHNRRTPYARSFHTRRPHSLGT